MVVETKTGTGTWDVKTGLAQMLKGGCCNTRTSKNC